MNVKGLIYSIRNVHNNKRYIGKTIVPLERRMAQHFSKMKGGLEHLLYEDMRLLGLDEFVTDILEDNLNKDELCERERYWIKYYDTTNIDNGYNYQSGGDTNFTNHPRSILKEVISKGGQAFLIYTLNKELVGEYISHTDASKITGIDRRKIGLYLRGNIGSEEYVFIYKSEMSEPQLDELIRLTKISMDNRVIVIDPQSNELISIYENVDVTSDNMNIPKNLIYPVLNGNRMTTNGYIFKYVNEKERYKCK